VGAGRAHSGGVIGGLLGKRGRDMGGNGRRQAATAAEENHEISVCILHLTACRCQDNYVHVSLCGYVWICELIYVCVLVSVCMCVCACVYLW